MFRIGITGVPGAGKTTLARSLCAKCRDIPTLENVELVSEYARRYISKHGDVTSIMEQYRILEKQLEWEDSVCNDKLDILITDSPVFLGFIYCTRLMYPKDLWPADLKSAGATVSSKDVMYFNDTFKKMSKLNFPTPRYDFIFHLPPTLEPVDDGVRNPEYFKKEWREAANSEIINTFRIFRPKKFLIINPVDIKERVDYAINVLLKKIEDNHWMEGQ